jgi:hypothetical protein
VELWRWQSKVIEKKCQEINLAVKEDSMCDMKYQ